MSMGLSADDLEDLRPATDHATPRVYLARLWASREYALRVPRDSLRGQNADTFLGSLWLLINPSLQIGVYYLIFGVLLGVDRGVDNFVGFLAIGVFVFQFSSRAATESAKSLVRNMTLIRAIAFPRALLPLTAVIEQSLIFVSSAVVMFLVLLATGESPDWTWFLIVPLFVLQFVCNLGLGLVLARLTHWIRDIENVLPFAFRLLFYGSGVLFLVDEYVEGNYVWLFVANPFYDLVALYRWALIGIDPSGPVLPAIVSLSIALLIGGAFFFLRGESTYGRG